MYTQTSKVMVKGKNFQSDNFVLSLRLKGAEAMRFWAILDRAKRRNHYAERTDVVRELLGLDEPNLLTQDDLDFFRSGEKGEPEILEISDADLVKHGFAFSTLEEAERAIEAERQKEQNGKKAA